MEINHRVKKLRKKLGFTTIESFTEVLYEDVHPAQLPQLTKHYTKVEQGKQPVDMKLVQLILKKFLIVNPHWLIIGIGQIDSPIDPKKDYYIHQTNSDSPDSTLRLDIIENEDLVKKIIADKDSHIERLERSMADMVNTYSRLTAQSSLKKSEAPKQSITFSQAAILILLCTCIAALFLLNQKQSPRLISYDLPKNIYYEKLLRTHDKKSGKYIDFQNGQDYCTFTLLEEVPTMRLSIQDHRQNLKFEQELKDPETKVYHSGWEPGVYYYFLYQDGKSVYVGSFTKY